MTIKDKEKFVLMIERIGDQLDSYDKGAAEMAVDNINDTNIQAAELGHIVKDMYYILYNFFHELKEGGPRDE